MWEGLASICRREGMGSWQKTLSLPRHSDEDEKNQSQVPKTQSLFFLPSLDVSITTISVLLGNFFFFWGNAHKAFSLHPTEWNGRSFLHSVFIVRIGIIEVSGIFAYWKQPKKAPNPQPGRHQEAYHIQDSSFVMAFTAWCLPREMNFTSGAEHWIRSQRALFLIRIS